MNKKEFYQKKAREYKGYSNRASLLRCELAVKLANIQNNSKVCDIGCNYGQMRTIFEKLGAKCEYYGVDITEEVIREAKKNGKGDFAVCDAMQGLPFSEAQFNYVFCLEVIEHVENPTLLLREIRRILKDEGVLILSTPNPYRWSEILANLLKLPERQGHISSFTFQTLRAVLEFCDFEILSSCGTYTLFPPVRRYLEANKFFIIRTNRFFLTNSFIYKIRKRK
jgi:2-polyprenyl-3-methyl-5-hydroxy-6-metoxy-1,4-benzoquinol methylase